MPVSDVQWSAREIHLPQILNEEASADEFSIWELVSSMAAERFAHRHMAPRPLSHTLPSASSFPKCFSPIPLTCPTPFAKLK
ncbi:hypothetical protein E5259_20300 [Blautia producta]|uniref:Uncharacterized protein n=2 Tax=Blautia producta TaxID=33035 RepID=A0A7G5N3N6_9FIRM|nr:hypothetical protein GXM18_23120 [Blautia producta ATCC 27340 = DSM 2950]QMW81479.1 hypothetical protein E5259_20300 [Blautia producta]